MTTAPTFEEKYHFLRENAEAFVRDVKKLVKAAEDLGDRKRAAELIVCALSPWEAALRADDSGDLWPICEICGEPIKDDADVVSSVEDACTFHRRCIED